MSKIKRGRPSNSNGDSQSDESNLVKKTFLFDKTMSQHLAVAAAYLGIEQSVIVREAVAAKLQEMFNGGDLSKAIELPYSR